MKKILTLALLFVIVSFFVSSIVFARGGGSRGGFRSSGRSYSGSFPKTKTSSYGGHTSRYSYSAPRDSSGHIKRSSEAKSNFMKQTGYPNGRKGYVVDHVTPLKKGGADSPSNMQWQTKEAAKAKDKWE